MLEQKVLTKKEAIKYLGLDEKTFDNYFKNAGEFLCLKRRKKSHFYFNEENLKKWKESYKLRTIQLTKDDYAPCLDFALAQHFRGYVMSDWSTGRLREFGQKVTNWVKGQLAEVAVKKFFKNEFGVDVELDFAIHDKIVPQDIIGVKENGTMRKPKIGIGIKSSKPKSAFLILSENEVDIKERRSNVYIFCRPDIPDDHLLRITRDEIIEIVKNQQHYSIYKEKIPNFTNIPCEIAGWVEVEALNKVKAKKIPGLENENGFRYVKKSGALHRSREKWQELINQL